MFNVVIILNDLLNYAFKYLFNNSKINYVDYAQFSDFIFVKKNTEKYHIAFIINFDYNIFY